MRSEDFHPPPSPCVLTRTRRQTVSSQLSALRGEVVCKLHATMIPKIGLCSQSLRNRRVFSRALAVLHAPWSRQTGLPAASRGIHVDSPPTIPTLTTSYAHGTSSTTLLHSTVGETLQRVVERFPDREAMAFLEQGVRKTFAQFQEDVDKASAGLLALGLTKGDRLGMWGPNTYEWILFQFATAKAGIILVSVNPAYQLQEAEYALRKVGCKAIVCHSQFKTQRYCDMLRQICPEIESSSPGGIKSARLPDLRSVIVLDSRQPGMFHFDDVMQAGSSQYVQQLHDLQKKLSFDDPINIQFTSGTTGAPKGATLSHFNIVNNAYTVGKRVGFIWRPHTRVCLPVPLYHCFGSVGGGMCMAVHGISLVFPSAGYDGKANLAAMESQRCTFVYGTPTMYVDMINQPDLAKYDLSSVHTGIMAGSPCPPEVVKQVISVMGIKGITEKADRWTARVSRQCSSVMKASSHPPFCTNTYVNTDSRCPSSHRLCFICICEGAKSFREVLDEPVNIMSSCVSFRRKRRAAGRGAWL
ncbi:medium-chain acyl-CoA ligase ACSF2, mitochondrial isoform X2 [Acanthopagrus latus]|uniref:medium-chain acyl-CoA ligase ACSF2, mitochondrial isoform X2 n=1 Tax=Acanthopagrus latus TaxID=8177 RepID=UPI00187CCEA5|nr:medium-chain acyl-CoA ligase ACSF2, mitochondrial isoform X2 [Acanthopagrus latus]XP_036937107.1 medium-chain acyl-CoA ligase ACSF2, mitochondrial isoform X2 [Acanthopagrus latus]